MISKAFCSTLNSRIGELENSIFDVTNKAILNSNISDYLKKKFYYNKTSAFSFSWMLQTQGAGYGDGKVNWLENDIIFNYSLNYLFTGWLILK